MLLAVLAAVSFHYALRFDLYPLGALSMLLGNFSLDVWLGREHFAGWFAMTAMCGFAALLSIWLSPVVSSVVAFGTASALLSVYILRS